MHLSYSSFQWRLPFITPFRADLKTLQKSGGKFGITGGPRGDDLFLWDVELSDFERGTMLYKDLVSYAQTYHRKVGPE